MNDNTYIEYIEQLLSYRIRAVNNNLTEDDIRYEEVYTKPNLLDFLKGKRKESSKKIIYKDDDIKELATSYINMKTKSEQSFISLWNFCEFIRWAEKLFLYRNNEDSLIFCDTSMSNIDTSDYRTFVINKNDVNIYFRLSMSSTIDIIDKDNNLDFHKTIDIVVSRKYGKEMKNKYTIVDGSFTYKYENDLMVMSIINLSLNKAISEVYMSILNNAYNFGR